MDFYKRRSGFKYGWNNIKTRFEINRSLKFPLYAYLLVSFIGITKMMPALFLRVIYSAARKPFFKIN
jgi:hypothetical protein